MANEDSAFKNDKNLNPFLNINSHTENILTFLNNIVLPATPIDPEENSLSSRKVRIYSQLIIIF